MTFTPRRLTSVHGRRLQLTSSGAFMDNEGFTAVMKSTADVVQNSTALLFSQYGVQAQTAIPTTVGSTLPNHGFVSMSSGTATGLSSATVFNIETPVNGVQLTIYMDCSASQVVFGGTSTAMVFHPAIAGAGSSLFLSSVPPLAGGAITLMGFDSSEWAIVEADAKFTVTIG